MSHQNQFLTMILFCSIFWFLPSTAQSGVILSEGFEDNILDSRIYIETTGEFLFLPGIKTSNQFGSHKAFGFGRSTCSYNCWDDHITRFIITFPEPQYVSSLSFKEKELYGNWGSEGYIFTDGVLLEEYCGGFSQNFGRCPVNDSLPDLIYRTKQVELNKVVKTIELQSWDITGQSEILIDNLQIRNDPTELALPSFIGDQSFDACNNRYYRFTLTSPTAIGIISTGGMDLKATLFQVMPDGSREYAVDLDHPNHISSSYTDAAGIKQKNFMIRPGEDDGTGKRTLAAGTYDLAVRPENTSAQKVSFGILMLTRPQSSNEFFNGLTLLLNDDDITNDFLDIYVKALYPDLYPSQNTNTATTNWGSTVTYGGVHWSRQCKALDNFFLTYILGVPHMEGDCKIDANLKSNVDDLLLGTGTLIYNDNSNPVFGSLNEVLGGDVWVKRINLVCSKGVYVSGYNHYGLAIDADNIIDANFCGKGQLCIAPINVRQPSKLVAPSVP